jgi:hypothetical protein
MVAVSKLPVLIRAQIPRVPFPSNYEAAKVALNNCEQIDEVKDWHDKSHALAAYAKQAKDQSLLYMANRIKVRAIARMGELLMQLRGENLASARKSAGIGQSQASQAVVVAKVPRDVRDPMIEASPPATRYDLFELAVKGGYHSPRYKHRDYSSPPRVEFFLQELEEILSGTSAEKLDGLDAGDVPMLREKVRKVIDKLDEIELILSKLGGH